MMKTSLLLLFAYLLGSVPAGLWIGQIFFKINLRDHGSGNTGTTNTFRILGVKAGLATFAFDFLKGTLATLLPLLFHLEGISPMIFGILAVLGHTFPIFADFKGGKAVATSAGVLLGFAPLFFLYLLFAFLLTLYLTSMISFASLSVTIFALVGIAIFPAYHFILPNYDPVFSCLITLMAFLIIFRHRDNIQRIIAKDENLVPFGLNLTHQKKKSKP